MKSVCKVKFMINNPKKKTKRTCLGSLQTMIEFLNSVESLEIVMSYINVNNNIEENIQQLKAFANSFKYWGI